MSDYIFDSARDAGLIAAGTHFYCRTHLSAVPLEERSPDPRYCKRCYRVLSEEAANEPRGRRPAWVPARPVVHGMFQSGPVPGNDVSIIILYRQRGRPRIIGSMSRTTRWRRLKETANQKEVLI